MRSTQHQTQPGAPGRVRYYTRHIGDHAVARGHLSLLEEGAWARLADVYVSRDGVLPQDPDAVARLIRAGSEDEREAAKRVLIEQFRLEDGGWVCDELDEQLCAAQVAIAEADDRREAERRQRSDAAVRKMRSRDRQSVVRAAFRLGLGVVPPAVGAARAERTEAWGRLPEVVREAARAQFAVIEEGRRPDLAAMRRAVAGQPELLCHADVTAITSDHEYKESASSVRRVAARARHESGQGKEGEDAAARQIPLSGMMGVVREMVGVSSPDVCPVELAAAAMRAAGCHSARAGDVMLRRMVDGGYSADELASAAAAAALKGKGLAWALACARGRRDDAATVGRAGVGAGVRQTVVQPAAPVVAPRAAWLVEQERIDAVRGADGAARAAAAAAGVRERFGLRSKRAA